jgi:hypothetical protein
VTVYRRGSSGSKDLTLAATAGLVAGSVIFYLARTWFRREPIGDVDGRISPEEGNLPQGESSPAPDRRSDSPPR